MNFADCIVVGIIVVILAFIIYVTRSKGSKNQGCGGCHKDCDSCHSSYNLFEEYQKDKEK